MHYLLSPQRRPRISSCAASFSTYSISKVLPFCQLRQLVALQFPSCFNRLSLILLVFFASIVSSTAAPIAHNLPSEAAEHMEGIMKYLPASIQAAMASSTGFLPAFLQSLLLILACELGDRTFFVAAILAMKSSRVVIWCGALSALAAMTILSAAIGKAFPLLLDKKWTSMAAALLFTYFGIQLLRDWWRMRNDDADENDELAEVEEELRADYDEKKGPAPAVRPRSLGSIGFALFSPVFAKAFSMTALAEWGDRSQIATIALAASRDMTGVIVGGVVGHAICTGLAVIGGRLLASSISEKAVALMGGILFLIFAVLTVTGVLE